LLERSNNKRRLVTTKIRKLCRRQPELLAVPPQPDSVRARCRVKIYILALQVGGWAWGIIIRQLSRNTGNGEAKALKLDNAPPGWGGENEEIELRRHCK
jgi:hypothetical protein